MDILEETALNAPDDMRIHRVLAAYASCVARHVELTAKGDIGERVRP
jgi:hypothetical protein